MIRTIIALMLAAATASAQVTLIGGAQLPVAGGGTPSASVQRVQVVIGSGSLTGYAAITAVDSTESFVYKQYGPNAASAGIVYQTYADCDWYTNSGTACDSVRVRRYNSTNTDTILIVVVSDPGITSQCIRSTIANAAAYQDVTVAAVDTAKTFVIGHWRPNLDAPYDSDLAWTRFNSTTSIRVARYGTVNAMDFTLFVVQYDSCVVFRRTSTANQATHTWSDMSGLSTTKTFVIVEMQCATAIMRRRMFNGWVTSSTTGVVASRENTSTQTVAAQFVTFTDGTTIQTDSTQLIGTNLIADKSVSAVDTSRASIHLPGVMGTYGMAGTSATTTSSHDMFMCRATFNSTTSVRIRRADQDGTQDVFPRFYVIEWGGVE